METSGELKEASSSDPSAIHAAIMQAWTCAFGGMRVIYLSGPITTGPRFIDDVRLEIDHARERAFDANSAELKAGAACVRRERSEIVVEPASLSITGWSQRDYIIFWETFIERHVRLVLFMPGWQFSAGCAAEFARATENGIPTQTVDGEELKANQGLAMLRAAANDMKDDERFEGIARLRASILTAINRIDAACL